MTTQRISSPIVGSKYHRFALAALLGLPDDTTLFLVRQPNNPHDPNAVAVFAPPGAWRGIQLGYVLRDVAKTLGPLMDARGLADLPCRYDKGDGRNPSVSVSIER